MTSIHISPIPQKSTMHLKSDLCWLIFRRCHELWLVPISHQSSLFRALNQATAAFLPSVLILLPGWPCCGINACWNGEEKAAAMWKNLHETIKWLCCDEVFPSLLWVWWHVREKVEGDARPLDHQEMLISQLPAAEMMSPCTSCIHIILSMLQETAYSEEMNLVVHSSSTMPINLFPWAGWSVYDI